MSEKIEETRVPPEEDFTGGLAPAESCSFVGSTGERKLDERLMALAQEIEGDCDPCLLAEMLTTAVRMARGSMSDQDRKLTNRSLKEMRQSAEVFHPYRRYRKVALFGSARTPPDEPEYQTAVEFSRRMRDENFMTITGAGPGIMAAGNEGAGRKHSFGLNITLPFESSANEFIAGDEKLIDYNYFFTRKLWFVKEADAAVGMPGGFGTMDEIFETITLIQTGKAAIYPIVLLDSKGGKYWKFWGQFIREHLHRLGMISDSDFSLFKITDDVEEAIDEIKTFYRNFHSYRYVGDRLVIRLHERLKSEAVETIQNNFSDLLKAGSMSQQEALPEEANEPELAELNRLVFRHRKRNFGRLRELIDVLNRAELA